MSEQQSAQVEERLMVPVDAEALGELLRALNGPGHYIRELQVTMDFDRKGLSDKPNPINLLTDQFNEFVMKHNANQTQGEISNGN
ncbi:hypothetical protein AVU38_gp139 [Ralstonia phage RSL2]|uniref:Uncharacterized protein n=1 Tax=Ralstonia phage RSL2 TaxID=1585840 RepID=A0A0A8J8W4_9CAUD|nr:hypothetical protein AVU38_gp139 [Ralstonia phage RSL2]BAQ02667.1 hypothetical protein [Ralstonia phage RSL2]